MQKPGPKAKVKIDIELVKRLINKQFPKYSHLSIQFLKSGWDNTIYCLGDHYLVRLPRRKTGADFILKEIKWLPGLKEILPIAIPVPVKAGKPDQHYPWYWSIVPMYPGKTANQQKVPESESGRFIDFLKILHSQSTTNVPFNQFRSLPLSSKVEATAERIERINKYSELLTPKVLALWQTALSESLPKTPCFIHGDLHPLNIIVDDEEIVAIIDWGDLTAGDPASDLASLWMLFDRKEILDDALKQYGACSSVIRRALGWAIFYGIFFLDTGQNGDLSYFQIGQSILSNINQYEY